MAIKILIDGQDVTDFYRHDALSLEITDVLNQPITCNFGLQTWLNAITVPKALPFELSGGETVSISDATQIYFDGIIPVEQGVGNNFRYIDSTVTPHQQIKVVRVHATDYQAVLDFVNQPNVIHYGKTCGQIIKQMLSASVLAGQVDLSYIADGYLLPQYSVWGRKFSNIVNDLAKMNGYYFSLRTSSLTPHKFVAEFQTLTSRPAPFIIDEAADRYDVSSLQFNPRDLPLCNKVTIVGGVIPSTDIRVDTFTGDGSQGGFQLSSVPFYMQPSALLVSEFGQPLPEQLVITDQTPILWSGNIQSGQLQNGQLIFSGASSLAYTTAFQCRANRYLLFQEIRLDSGSDIVVGMFTSPTSRDTAHAALACHFKSDGTIQVITNGVEQTPVGNPTWNPRTVGNANIYSVRVKQALDDNGEGTYIEIQGGNLSPDRHWLPLLPPGDAASASVVLSSIDTTSTVGDVIQIGSTATLTAGTVCQLIIGDNSVAPYILRDEDIATPTTFSAKFYENITVWFSGGQGKVYNDYTAAINYDTGIDISGASVGTDGTVTLTLHSPASTATWASTDTVDIDSARGLTAINGSKWPIRIVDDSTIVLVGCDGTGQTYVNDTATLFRRLPGASWTANQGGSVYNTYIRLLFYAANAAPNAAPIFEYDNSIQGGTDRGLTFGSVPTAFVAALFTTSGNGAITSIIVRDPVGVDVKLKRAAAVVLPGDPTSANYKALQDAQQTVILTVAAADDVSEDFSAQVLLEGGVPFLSFFADTSAPNVGDVLEVAYQYQLPLRVTVTDVASMALVAFKSQIPGDKGLREATDVDVTGKLFDSDAAIKYGQQFIRDRAGLHLQGSVHTSSFVIGGVPLSGQALFIALNDRTETVAQVTSRYLGTLSNFDYDVAFGKIPEEFLLPTENPLIRQAPATLVYDVNSVTDAITAKDSITFTY